MNASMTSGCHLLCPGLLVISFFAAARLGHVSRLFQYICNNAWSNFSLLVSSAEIVASRRTKLRKSKSLLI